MKILALIPARGGSKRLPGKNSRLLGGLPLIAWTIRAAVASGVCTEVVVSTDDPSIAQLARAHGAAVPRLRSAELSTDDATSVDVAIDELDFHEGINGRVDGLMLLQPTSPFRTAETIRRALAMFIAAGCRHPVVGVSPASCHPAWCFRLVEDGMLPFLGWEGLQRRSQDLDPAWILNGAIYIISPQQLRLAHAFVTPETRPCLMSEPKEALDIDTALDWAAAEAALTR